MSKRRYLQQLQVKSCCTVLILIPTGFCGTYPCPVSQNAESLIQDITNLVQSTVFTTRIRMNKDPATTFSSKSYLYIGSYFVLHIESNELSDRNMRTGGYNGGESNPNQHEGTRQRQLKLFFNKARWKMTKNVVFRKWTIVTLSHALNWVMISLMVPCLWHCVSYFKKSPDFWV